MVPHSRRIALARIGFVLLLLLPASGCRSSKLSVATVRNIKPDGVRSSKPAATRSRDDAATDPVNHTAGEDEVSIQLTAAEETLPSPVQGDPASVRSGVATVTDANPAHEDTQSIDLTTALLLTSGGNPQVGFAHARIEEARAQVQKAEVLWLPSIRMGANYNQHEGNIQDVAGNIINTTRGSFFTGFGANAVGAGSPTIPGLLAQFHLADAVFQPRIAQQTASARNAGAQAATNDALLQTALAYLTLLRSAQELAVAIDIEQKAKELERVTGEFAHTGQGLASDHDRARTELALRTNDVRRAEEAVGVASARLAEQIRWDSSRRLVPLESQLIPLELVHIGERPQALVAMALTQRPEVAESRHLVCEAVERLQRERYAPLIPSVLLGVSYGGLGGGLGGNLTNFNSRVDADAIAYWEIRQLGLGDQAARREADSRIQQSKFREIALLDRVAREVVEAHVQVTSRAQQITTGQVAVEAAEDSFSRNWERIQNGQGLPVEVLQSIQALAVARREYVRVVADYNTAQFTLHRSLGWPIQ
ncbi:TolC family protein [Schlesneria paludicola]|uniref:TolC family protein n=1 Tax=Schlesneria paludicola TaxID=360056 RepID=UPI000299D85C|nr:TolC family protein [Schlesneria paludicola]